MSKSVVDNEIRLQDLTCWRGGRPVFEGLTASAQSGNAIILNGKNGTGKSSLLRLLAGFISTFDGSIQWIMDRDEDQPLHSHLFYLDHRPAVKSFLTVYENLEFWAQFSDNDAKRAQSIKEAADFWNLTELLSVRGDLLSQGQKQRVALARFLLDRRALWLMDEPHAGLDRDSNKRLILAIDRHMKMGGIAILSSHVSVPLQNTQTVNLDHYAPKNTAGASS